MPTSVPASSSQAEDAPTVNPGTAPPASPARTDRHSDEPRYARDALFMVLGVLAGRALAHAERERDDRRADKAGFIIMLLVITAVIIFFTRCTGEPPAVAATTALPVNEVRQAVSASGIVTTTTASAVADDCRSEYLIVVVLIDNTASMHAAPVARPALDTLTPLTEHLARCGGAIAVGALADRATVFESSEIDSPPARPEPATRGGDLITRAVLAAEDDDASHRYEAAVAAWRNDAAAKIADFRIRVRPIFEPENLTLSTDLVSGLLWADTFFLQPRAVPVQQHRFVVLAFTDGQHDADDRLVPALKSRPEFVLISTTGNGDLPFATIPATSMQAAVSYVLTPRLSRKVAP